MNYQLIGERYIELMPGAQIRSERDALDVVAACGENGVSRVMIHAVNLNDDFYNLRTGLAGAVLLKWSNYRIRAAAVLDPAISRQGRFGEMVLETNRGSQFRVFADRETADAWLNRQ